ncbi:RCC1 domain-containing protein [Myxococcota bacterium]
MLQVRTVLIAALLVSTNCLLEVPDPGADYPCLSDHDCLSGYGCVDGFCREQSGDDGECVPETDALLCAKIGADCDFVFAEDNCGTNRTVHSCGTCTPPDFCGGGGPNVCGSGPCLALAPGTINPEDPCEWCEPAQSLAIWSPVACEQSAPFDPCHANVGSCNPNLNNGTCVGLACCELDPAWPEGSPEPAPDCPLAGDDLDGDGVKNENEEWRGSCNHAGQCTGCNVRLDCDYGNPCTDDSCVDGVCYHDRFARLGDDCPVESTQDGMCVAVPADIACRRKDGQICTEPTDCASGYCVHGRCCSGPCSGGCGRCDVSGSEGLCSPDISHCTGACPDCTGDGPVYDCTPDQGLCPSTTATLCTSCACVDTHCDCTYDETQDADCPVGFECSSPATCLKAIGNTCTNGDECASGSCAVDGHCWEPDGLHGVHTDGGSNHMCAALSDGTVRCWGENHSETPVVIAGVTNAVSVAAGDQHTCALTLQGTVKCWGFNDVGELGDNGACGFLCHEAVLVPGLANVVHLSAGGRYTCAVVSSGAAYCWGMNNEGQLGDGSVEDRHVPTLVQGLEAGAEAVGTGNGHTCVLLSSGEVACWGRNDFGQLGDWTTDDRHLFGTHVVNLEGVETLAVGGDHACVLLRDDRTAACWGRNDFGQLGNTAGGTFSTEPVAVMGLTDVVFLSDSEGWHTCALTADDLAWCWGANFFGAIGDGTTEDRPAPVQVAEIHHVVFVGTGYLSTCAVLAGGSEWCWGQNETGQLGNGTNTESHTPVLVAPW